VETFHIVSNLMPPFMCLKNVYKNEIKFFNLFNLLGLPMAFLCWQFVNENN
jgi:hypothetical protein